MPAPYTHLSLPAIAAVLIAIGSTFAGPAGAADDGNAHECPMHSQRDGVSAAQMMQQFRDEFGLTGQQQTDIQIIVADYGERLRDIARIGSDTASDLLATDPDDPSYRDKTDEAAALAANSAAETVVLLAEMRAKLHAVLTPAQRETLSRKLEEKKTEYELKKQQRQEDGASHDRPFGQFIG